MQGQIPPGYLDSLVCSRSAQVANTPANLALCSCCLQALSQDTDKRCCAARGVGYVFRALAEHSVTKVNFEASLILSSAATFLFIGALGHLLAHW